MPLVLAIEPDPQQAEAVRRAVGQIAGVDLIVVDRMEAATATLSDRVPHLILMSALLSPADETALTTMLRTRADAAHVQMMTIPRLETTRGDRGRGFFGMFSRRKEREENELRCDPAVFADQIRTHLDEVRVALANAPPPPIDWSGFRDSIGERAAALDADGRAVELLRAGPELSGAEDILREDIARLMEVVRPHVARTLRLDHDEDTGLVMLIGEWVAGVRLSEVLARAAERAVVPDLPAALFIMRRLLSAAGSVRAASGLDDVAISAERVVVTPRGHLVVVEAALARAIRTMVGSAGDGWRRDVRSIASIGVATALARPADENDDDSWPALLDEATDVAAIRAGEAFSTALRSWLDRALANDAGEPFEDFDEAAVAFARACSLKEGGCMAPRRTRMSAPTRKQLQTPSSK